MLSDKSLCALIINAIFVKVLLGFPRMAAENSGNAAWIQVLYNVTAVFLIFCFIMRITAKKKNIIESIQNKWLRYASGIIVSAVLLINLLYVVRLFPEEVKVAMLQETDKKLLIIILIAASAIGAYLGIEAIARSTQMFLPIIVIIFIISAILLIPKYNTENLFPIFGLGAKRIFIGGFNTVSLFSDLIALNLLMPYAENLGSVKRCGKAAIIVSGIGAMLVELVYCLTFSYPISKEFVIPLYNMARLIDITSFFSRFEAFYEFVWTIVVLLYTSLYMYLISYTLKASFSFKAAKILLLPVCALVFALSVIPGADMMLDKFWKYSYIPAFSLMILFRGYAGRREL